MTGWCPIGAQRVHRRLEVGELLAFDHAVYRVVEVLDRPEDLWTDDQRAAVAAHPQAPRPYALVSRPVDVVDDDPRARDRDIHLLPRSVFSAWWVFPSEHYPVCRECREPMPCREVSAERQASVEMERMSRFEDPSVCPACLGLITLGQRRQTFDMNLVIPGGPPVTFHLRQRCFRDAYEYDMRMRREVPEADPVLCGGLWRDEACEHGPTGCSAEDCTGPQAHHGWRGCDCQTPKRRRRANTGECKHCLHPVRRDDTRNGLWVHVGTDLPRCAGAGVVALPRGLKP